MSTEIASLYATLSLVDNLTGGLKTANNSFSSFASNIGSQLKSMGATLTAGITAPLVAFGAASIKASTDSALSIANLNNAVKDNGSITGVTSQAALNLANSLDQVSLFSKNDIIDSEGVLARFTNIGKNVFPTAEQAALDLATGMKMDLGSAAKALGQLLNDPTANFGKLARAGVQFTEAIKTQVKTMIASGDLMGAQKVLLQSIEDRFKGAAAAAANVDPWTMLNKAFTALQVSVGGLLNFALKPLVERVTSFIENLSKLNPKVLEIGLVVGVAAAALGPLLGILGNVATVVGFLASGPIGFLVAGVAALGLAFATNFGGIRDLVMPIINNIVNAVGLFFAQIGDFVSNVKKYGLAAALLSALNLGDGKKYAQGWIEGVLTALGVGKDNAIKIVSALSDAVKGNFSGLADLLSSVWSDAWTKIQSAISGLFQSIGTWISTSAWPAIQDAFGVFFNAIGAWITDGGAAQLASGIRSAIAGVGTWIVNNAWNLIKGAFVDLFTNDIKMWMGKDGSDQMQAGMQTAISNLVTWLKNVGFPQILQAFQDLVIPNPLAQFSGGKSFGSGLAAGANTVGPIAPPSGLAGALANLVNGALFIGARAGGGPVSSGRPYMVGENGPELFTPSTSGNITPSGGGGPSVLHLILQAQNFEEHIYYNIAGAKAAAH